MKGQIAMSIETILTQKSEYYKEALSKRLLGNMFSENLINAMKYTCLSGGKFVRPFLTSEFCRVNGGSDEDSVDFACAVEMIHSYSLIHDDLPCMDNDNFRRGKPANHVRYGQAGALLAGDGLQTRAFETISKAPLSAEKRIEAVRILSEYAGPDGMVGGQQLDCEHLPGSPAKMIKIHEGKTGALIVAACLLGVVAAGGDADAMEAAMEYAKNIGLAFQIVDDILDVTGEKEVLGKPVGSDAGNGKTTFVTVYGIEKSREMANEYTEKAKQAIENVKDNDNLCQLADYLLERIK